MIWIVWGMLKNEPSESSGEASPSTTASLEDIPGELTIHDPKDGIVFPADFAPHTFRWNDTEDQVRRWRVRFQFPNGLGEPLQSTSSNKSWTPSPSQWQTIRERSSVEKIGPGSPQSEICIEGLDEQGQVLTSDSLTFRTSVDPVGAPIFYREVNLPFEEAVKDPGKYIRWRFGSVASPGRPPIVLEKLPVCGNCHSFSADGRLMGMDVDYANDKGSYTLCPVSEEMVLDDENIITWSDYRPKDNKRTFGLLSRVSPDGRYVISTVKDLSVFLAIDDLAFSQLFFPIQGILVCYDRQTGTFAAVPGADDPDFVQSNPVWSPDGKDIVFARSEAFEVDDDKKSGLGLSNIEDAEELLTNERKFRFDLYRVPFNEGRGGKAEPLEGASHNGKSNYFAKYSPDGKWIVFCQAEEFMLLQPDSHMYIIPAEGGTSRRLACNTSRMNSWHSWSPNSRWLVFASKENTIYTQLFLTHVDSRGCTTPPICLSRFTQKDMAANIPEFVNASPDAIRRIREDFITPEAMVMAGRYNLHDKAYRLAIKSFRQAIEMDPRNVEAYVVLGNTHKLLSEIAQAENCYRKALEIDPQAVEALHGLGEIHTRRKEFAQARELFEKVLSRDSEHVITHAALGMLLVDMGETEKGKEHIEKAIALAPDRGVYYSMLGSLYLRQKENEQAAQMYREALQRDPECLPALMSLSTLLAKLLPPEQRDIPNALAMAERACELKGNKDPLALVSLSEIQAEAGLFQDALRSCELALPLARVGGDADMVQGIQYRMHLYRNGRKIESEPPPAEAQP